MTTEAALQQWGRVWSEASEKICLLSLLSLAEVAHEQGVTRIILGWSDQGDWLSVDHIAGVGEDIDEDDAYDIIIEESFAIGDLRGEWQSTWGGFVAADERGQSFELDVAHVLSELSADEIGVPN